VTLPVRPAASITVTDQAAHMSNYKGDVNLGANWTDKISAHKDRGMWQCPGLYKRQAQAVGRTAVSPGQLGALAALAFSLRLESAP
jgi:hypothetical protein